MSRPPSTLLYAMGGGLGHLTRVSTALVTDPELRALFDVDDTGRVHASPAPLVVSASPWLDLVARRQGFTPMAPPPLLNGDRAAFAAFMARLLIDHDVELLVVDCFPAGILGELPAALSLAAAAMRRRPRVVHLARRLNVSAYLRRAPRPWLPADEVLAVEPLSAEHRDGWCGVPRSLVLTPLAHRGGELKTASTLSTPSAPFTLVVHSGDDNEHTALGQAAAELQALDLPPLLHLRPDEGRWPVTALWEQAAFVVSGAGCNAVAHSRSLGLLARERHHLLAFPRALDDQLWRKAWATTTFGQGVS